MYTRYLDTDVQIRLDLLNYTDNLDYDLYLALDTAPGGASRLPVEAQAAIDWDVLLTIPASGDLAANLAGGKAVKDLQLRVMRDPFLDTVVVSMDRKALHLAGPVFRVQAFLTPAGSPHVVDSLGPARSDSTPPPPAHVLLAFWNTFPAATPAQALRRWNGAHTGPGGGRHGLRALLTTLDSTQVPAALLDLKAPEALSALEYIGVAGMLRSLAHDDLAMLPDVISIAGRPADSPLQPPGWVLARTAAASRQTGIDFNLRGSQMLYAPDLSARLFQPGTDLPSSYRLLFTSADEVADKEPLHPGGSLVHCSRWGSMLVIPLPKDSQVASQSYSKDNQQASEDGPSDEVRRNLLKAALPEKASPSTGSTRLCEEQPLLLLGGDLTQSAWGNPPPARNTLLFLKAHPWIQFVTASDLLTAASDNSLPVPADPIPASYVPNTAQGNPIPSGQMAAAIETKLLDALRAAPQNNLSELAWQAYQALLEPATPETPALEQLRAGYLGQIGHLLAAAHWASLSPEQACSVTSVRTVSQNGICTLMEDLDWDGQPEYVLISPNFFGIFEIDGGYLAEAFTRDSTGVHQVIGPTSQFTIGLGDASAWDPGCGIAGDPGQVRGAFSDIPAGGIEPFWQPFQVEKNLDQLIFTSPDGIIRKTFELNSRGLWVRYQTQSTIQVQVPLALDPWLRFQLAWDDRYQGQALPHGWSWRLSGGPAVELFTDGELSYQAFNDSRAMISKPEDPNYDYPQGHYLPFPLALALVRSEGDFSIWMNFR